MEVVTGASFFPSSSSSLLLLLPFFFSSPIFLPKSPQVTGEKGRDALPGYFCLNHHKYTWDTVPGTPSFFIRINTSIRGTPYLGHPLFLSESPQVYVGHPTRDTLFFYPNHHKYTWDTLPGTPSFLSESQQVYPGRPARFRSAAVRFAWRRP